MNQNLKSPDLTELKPRITVVGVGGAGGNAVNNMIASNLEGVEFVVANTDAQALSQSKAERRIQMGANMTEGLGAGSKPEIGAAAAEEAMTDLKAQLVSSHMVFITAGMGGGTGTGAAPVIARAAREEEILTVGVVTKPFQFEGQRRMTIAESGIAELAKYVDTLIVIPNQNLFRVATEKTTFADAFALADEVLHSGVACVTDLMVKEGLINLDFADVKAVMAGRGKAMMGTGVSSGEQRALDAAEAAISNPLLDDVSMRGASGLLISITGGNDLTLYEVDEAASRIREEVAEEANIILGATFDETLDGKIRVSVVATGLEPGAVRKERPSAEVTERVPAPEVKVAAPTQAPPRQKLVERLGEIESPTESPAPTNVTKPAQADPRTVPGDVTIQQRPAQLPDRDPKVAEAEAKPIPAASTFVPKPPAAVKRGPRRMPAIEDLPAPAQKQIEASRGPSQDVGLAAQKKKVGFFERLTGGPKGQKDQDNNGLRENEPRLEDGPIEGENTTERTGGQAGAGAPAAERPRNAPGPRRRGPTIERPKSDDDELEIPAFLRRQAN